MQNTSSWFDKTEEEIIQRLKNVLRTEDFQFIGKYESFPQNNFGFFKDVRSLSGVRKFYPTNEGYPDENKVRPLEIYTKSILKYDNSKKTRLLEGKWYKFYSVPASTQLCKSKDNPFLLQADLKRVKDISLLKGNELIENIKKDSVNTPESTASKLRNAIETISVDINTEPTTFIFELIQNADDYPNKNNNVSIAFEINNSHLIIKHDGSSFEVNNTVAICGVNDGDKREDKNKIGFKGIGFKSIFKDANLAYIKSGDFSFRFDEKFWVQQGIEMFWHITPINTSVNEFKDSIKIESNVNIIIRPRILQTLKTYRDIFITHFNDERILLFLRNVKSLKFVSSEEEFEISNSLTKWRIFVEKNIAIPDNETNELNWRINLPDKRIPIKFHDITMTELGFGFKTNQNKVESISDGSIYAYLPTRVNLGFSFILNGNFIPDASRTKIYKDLTWNLFLFEKAGELFIKQIISLLNEDLNKESIFEQIPNFQEILLNINDEEKITFINNFKKGFEKEIANQYFIPAKTGTLEKLSNILIDETGLAELLKNDFSYLTGIIGRLIHNDVGAGMLKVKHLISEYNEGKIYTMKDLIKDFQKPNFQEWLKQPLNNFKLIKHLSTSDNLELKSLLNTEEIILSESNQLLKISDLFSATPKEIDFIPTEKINNELFRLLENNNITVALKEFDVVEFYKESILGKHLEINSILVDESSLLNFWRFIFNNWIKFEEEKPIIDSLQNFYVLCKHKNGNEPTKNMVSFAYLSTEFNSSNEIESIVEDIIENPYFISEKYIQNVVEIETWGRIFKKAKVITDLQKVIEVLLPNLSKFSDFKHFEITKQIYKFWKKPDNKLTNEQIGLIKTNLKIKCINGEFKKTTECIISDHFTDDSQIDLWLPSIELSNQITHEYEDRKNHAAGWKNFFIKIGCVKLNYPKKVVETKLNYFINTQEELKENHFEILKEINYLFNIRSEKKINTRFFNIALKKIRLLTKNHVLALPIDIHFPERYKPKLELENDTDLNFNVSFLHEKYLPNEISKAFLIYLGVNHSFCFYKPENPIHIDKVQGIEFVSELESINPYLKRIEEIKQMTNVEDGTIVRKHSDEKIRLNTTLSNNITINYPQLLKEQKYIKLFLQFVIDMDKIDILSEEVELKIWMNNIYKYSNYILWLLQKNCKLFNQEDILKSPSELYSLHLAGYIKKSDLPKIDYTKFKNKNGVSLEELLGVQQKLSSKHCLEILSRSENQISFNQFKKLQIIDVLLKATNILDEEKSKLFLINRNLEWKPINDLVIFKDDNFQIESNQQLHEIFYPIADNLDVPKLSKDDLIIKTIPEVNILSEEIKGFTENKGKYIAFKIDQNNYTTIEKELIEKIDQIKFFQVQNIEHVFREEIKINFFKPYDFYVQDDLIYYTGNWEFNLELIDWLIENVFKNKIEKPFFQNLISKTELEIITALEFEFGKLPWIKEDNKREIKENGSEITKPQEQDNAEFLNEVYSFIEKDYTQVEITEIKQLLIGFKEGGENRRYLLNTIAKLKLIKELKVAHLSIDDFKNFDFHEVIIGNDKYLIHSARSSFAYISPSDLIKMKEDNYFLALDFGKKRNIKIIKDYKDVLNMNENKIIYFQGDRSIEDLYQICIKNNIKNAHFLMIDRDNELSEDNSLNKLLNKNEDFS